MSFLCRTPAAYAPEDCMFLHKYFGRQRCDRLLQQDFEWHKSLRPRRKIRPAPQRLPLTPLSSVQKHPASDSSVSRKYFPRRQAQTAPRPGRNHETHRKKSGKSAPPLRLLSDPALPVRRESAMFQILNFSLPCFFFSS